jgi:hypothetical protein
MENKSAQVYSESMESQPPIIATHHPAARWDFYWRCTSAFAINVVGFWWPDWYASQIPPEGDSRVGVVFIFTFPFLLAADAWATASFKWAYRPRYVSVGLLLLVWAPALLIGFRIISVALFVGRELHN